MTQSHCETSPGSFDECRLSAGLPSTLRPSQSTLAVSLPKIGCNRPHPPSPLLLILSPSADTHLVQMIISLPVMAGCRRRAWLDRQGVDQSVSRDRRAPAGAGSPHRRRRHGRRAAPAVHRHAPAGADEPARHSATHAAPPGRLRRHLGRRQVLGGSTSSG